jgi:hypothetical protein
VGHRVITYLSDPMEVVALPSLFATAVRRIPEHRAC